MVDPYFKPSGPLVSDRAVAYLCGTLILLGVISGGVTLGMYAPETFKILIDFFKTCGVGLALFVFLVLFLLANN